jgi:hypothetical protein
MKLPALFQELEEVASRLGLAVVLDRGSFKGGDCILEGEEMVVLNKATPLELQARHLAEALGKRDLQGIYLKPAVRLFLDRYQDLGLFDERTQTTQGS